MPNNRPHGAQMLMLVYAQTRAYYGRLVKRLDSALTSAAQESVHEVQTCWRISSLPLSTQSALYSTHHKPATALSVCGDML